MISNPCRNAKQKTALFIDPAEIPGMWREYAAIERLIPKHLLGGVARARTRLLDKIPHHLIPEILDHMEASA